ncbi:MAG: hypothetical protein ACI9R3_003869 [Verrucomicrobiales bacterium]|jgi:hypothetical protein
MSERNAPSNIGDSGAFQEGSAVLTPQAFTGLFSACLQHSCPELVVQVTGNLELETGDGGKNPRKAFLDNAYSVYLQNPSSRDDVIDGFVASHLDLIDSGVSDDIDLQRIVPVVKDKAWVENLALSLVSHSNDEDKKGGEIVDSTPADNEEEPETFPVPVHESLNSELDVVYAEDSPHNIRYLNDANLETLGIDQQELRKQAIENLTALLQGEVEVHGGEGVFLISAGGNYEASFLLFDEFWESDILEVEGDYVVAIPTRDLLLVTGSKNVDGIERVRNVAGDASSSGAYTLTPVLFVRKDGAFEVFEG